MAGFLPEITTLRISSKIFAMEVARLASILGGIFGRLKNRGCGFVLTNRDGLYTIKSRVPYLGSWDDADRRDRRWQQQSECGTMEMERQYNGHNSQSGGTLTDKDFSFI
jgi:hypothetical protein